MISNVASTVVDDLLDFFKTRGIQLVKQYSPDLGSISRFVRDYLITETSSVYASRDCSKYKNSLMYNIGTPTEYNDAYNNNKISSYMKYSKNFTDIGTIKYTKDEKFIFRLKKYRNNIDDSDSGKLLCRDVSYLILPINFMIMSESIDNLYDCLLLLKQRVKFMNYLDVPLRLDPNSKEKCDVEYWLKWDTNDVNIGYANFNENALNTLEFKCEVTGGFFSNYTYFDNIIDQIDVKAGFINAKSANTEQE